MKQKLKKLRAKAKRKIKEREYLKKWEEKAKKGVVLGDNTAQQKGVKKWTTNKK